ncbi:MAG: hypothetical protein Q9188_004780 [Gyalolechia gomerana]
MSTVDLGDKIEELSDLELALLLSLTANEHCLIQTEGDALDALGLELQLVWLFPKTTLDDFTNGLLVESWADEVLDDADVIEVPRGSQIARDTTNPGAASRPTHTGNSKGSRRIADVIILKNLDLADYELQIQALEVGV